MNAINFFPINPCDIDLWILADRENSPRSCHGFRISGKDTAFASRNDDVSKAARVSVEHKILDHPYVFAARVLDLGADDRATLDIAGCGTRCRALGLCDCGSGGQAQDGQRRSEEGEFFHKY